MLSAYHLHYYHLLRSRIANANSQLRLGSRTQSGISCVLGTQTVRDHDKTGVCHMAGGRTNLDSRPQVLLLLHRNAAVVIGEFLRGSRSLPQLGNLLRQLLHLLFSGLACCFGRLQNLFPLFAFLRWCREGQSERCVCSLRQMVHVLAVNT
jgi:hypothetical protein